MLVAGARRANRENRASQYGFLLIHSRLAWNATIAGLPAEHRVDECESLG
jgi:hypothetical protein